MPIVVMNVFWNVAAEYCSSRHVLPTALSPIVSSLICSRSSLRPAMSQADPARPSRCLRGDLPALVRFVPMPSVLEVAKRCLRLGQQNNKTRTKEGTTRARNGWMACFFDLEFHRKSSKNQG